MNINAAAHNSRSLTCLFPVLLRYSVIIAFVAVLIFFSLASPTFFTLTNFVNVLVNNFAILAIVSLGMTLVITSGGIDLSVGTAIDLSSLFYVSLVANHQNLGLALGAGILGALSVGLFNAFLVTRLMITPFLATMGTLFIGQSVQQLATNGGQPIYLITGTLPDGFVFIGRGELFGLPCSLYLVLVCAFFFFLALHRTAFGRYATALGLQPGIVWYSGVRSGQISTMVYILASLVCGIAGILLSSTVKAYVPLSGNAYLLNAIGATFIGTTLHRENLPTVLGTIFGVLLLSFVANGLLLVGWNFYWQQVGTGVLIFLVLAVSFLGRKVRGYF
jgi:ribose transport system permease protein